MMERTGRVFIKSEYAPISDEWPCLSFSRRIVEKTLREQFRAKRDVLLYVGTTNAETTENPDHRSRILSAISVEPFQVLETKRIIPEEHWRKTVQKYGADAWRFSFAVIDASLTLGAPLPAAREVIPKAYASLAEMRYRGNVVEVTGDEREAAMQLSIQPIKLNLSPAVLSYMELKKSASRSIDKTIRQEAARMAALIEARVKNGGEFYVGRRPIRTAPNTSDLISVIIHKWTEVQFGRCALCGSPIEQTTNKMLQPSADRIQSDEPSYAKENIQITHLACNWAKNQYGFEEYSEWVAVVRDFEA